MTETRILVLAGSAVDEFHADLSRVYTSGFMDALGDGPYDLRIAFISPDRTWRFPDAIDAASVSQAQPLSLSEAVDHLASGGYDVVVPQMFCMPGMTTYRSLFDLLGIDYLGNRPSVMAMTADKSVARAVVKAAGVAVPDGAVIRTGEHCDPDLPVIVKPVDSDNSMGVTLVRDRRALAAALDDAWTYSSAALVESYVPLGREVRCGIIEQAGELICLPLEEYAVNEEAAPIRGRGDKLDRTGSGDLYLVAKQSSKAWIVDIDDPVTEAVWAAARTCHRALNCRHYSLFDFRIDPSGKPWFLEAGLYCSYSPSSVIAVMASAAGISIEDLFATGLQEVLP